METIKNKLEKLEKSMKSLDEKIGFRERKEWQEFHGLIPEDQAWSALVVVPAMGDLLISMAKELIDMKKELAELRQSYPSKTMVRPHGIGHGGEK